MSKQAEEIEKIKKLEKIRKDFVSNVSHELNTPLTAILSAAEILSDELKDKQNKHFVDIIIRQSKRMQALVTDLLLLSKLEADEYRQNITFMPVSLKDILLESYEACLPDANKRGVPINIKCLLELKINANFYLVEQALTNLLTNAIKYGDEANQVTVNAYEDNANTYIEVIDKGNGIPDEYKSRIFERFYRVDKGRSRKEGGTGLGLSLVKHIMNVHSGSVEVKSNLDKGSTFLLRFPKNPN